VLGDSALTRVGAGRAGAGGLSVDVTRLAGAWAAPLVGGAPAPTPAAGAGGRESVTLIDEDVDDRSGAAPPDVGVGDELWGPDAFPAAEPFPLDGRFAFGNADPRPPPPVDVPPPVGAPPDPTP
jgi:hypothetical protein